MEKIPHNRYRLTFLLIAALAASPAFAEKPPWAGGGGKHKHEEDRYDRHEERDRDRGYNERSFYERGDAEFRPEPYFNDRHRTVVRDYYADQFRSGRCPPGLAKKHNGCMPPGQARKWAVGQPLPRDVVYYEVPAGMIGYPPPGYRFVRVASDILMIAVGTGMVVEALTDLGGW